MQGCVCENESWAAVLMPFRPISHPDLSDLLTHFTARARPAGPGAEQWIRTMTPWQRLASIIDGEELIPAVTYSGGHPAVCFTESTEAGLAYLIRNEGYQPWGVVLRREWIWSVGGGPVWYFRPEYENQVQNLPPDLRTWHIRLSDDPRRPSDWVHEREWRVPRLDGAPLKLTPDAIAAVIVGDPRWAPDGMPITDQFGEYLGDWPTACWHAAQRWVWNGTGFNFLAPT